MPLFGRTSAEGTVDVTLEATGGFRVSGARIIFSLDNLRADRLTGHLTLRVAGQKLPIPVPASQLTPLVQQIMDYVRDDLPTYSVPVTLPLSSSIGFSLALADVYLAPEYLLAGMDIR